MVVLLEPAKSAEPPKNVVILSANALITSPLDARLANALSSPYVADPHPSFLEVHLLSLLQMFRQVRDNLFCKHRIIHSMLFLLLRHALRSSL